MIDFLRRSWAVVSLDRVSHNIARIRERLSPGCMIMGVVKADGYGHGDRYIAAQLVHDGVSWLGVSNLDEAMALREHGIYHPILILGLTPPNRAEMLNRYNITQTVFSLEYAQRLQTAAAEAGVSVDIHIKVDTGMSRLGFTAEDGMGHAAVEEILAVSKMPCLRAGGIFTHFAVADEDSADSDAYTLLQYERFTRIVEELRTQGVKFAIKHCCNSAATLRFPHMHMDMVRTGITVYGLAPSACCADIIDLHPAMELYSCVSMVHDLPKGTPVSYGRCYIAHRDMRVATVAIGYADGYERELSNRSRMLVRGQYAPVIGRVCMDQLILDVTHIPQVAAGDTVTIVGTDGENALDFDEMARLSGTINYEKVCLIGKRVPRIYRSGGKDVAVIDYRGNRQ